MQINDQAERTDELPTAFGDFVEHHRVRRSFFDNLGDAFAGQKSWSRGKPASVGTAGKRDEVENPLFNETRACNAGETKRLLETCSFLTSQVNERQEQNNVELNC